MARQLHTFLYRTEKVPTQTWHNTQGAQVLVVEDVVTTEVQFLEAIKVVKARYQKGSCRLVDRSNGQVDLGYPLFSLLSKVQSHTQRFVPYVKRVYLW